MNTEATPTTCESRKSLPPAEAVLVLVVHQAFGLADVGQSGGQQAVVPVHHGQTLVLQLDTPTSGALSHLIHLFVSMVTDRFVIC